MTLTSIYISRLFVRLDRGTVDDHRTKHRERCHARLCSRARQPDHQPIRRFRRHLDIASGQCRRLLYQLASATSDSSAQTALATAPGLAQTIKTAPPHLERQRRAAERQFAGGDDRDLQSALATHETNPSSAPLADNVITAANARLVAERGFASGLSGGRTGRPEHGVGGHSDRFTARAVPAGQRRHRERSGARRGRFPEPKTNATHSVPIHRRSSGWHGDHANGSMPIYTDSGVTLFQNVPQTVSFQATATYVPGVNGNAVTVGGIAITGPGAPMAI